MGLALCFPLEVAGPRPLSNSPTPWADFSLAFEKSETHYGSEWPSSSRLTTNILSFHPGKQEAFLEAGEPTRVQMLPLGSWRRREDSQGLAASHLTIPGTQLHMELCGSPGQRGAFLSAQRSADKRIIN